MVCNQFYVRKLYTNILSVFIWSTKDHIIPIDKVFTYANWNPKYYKHDVDISTDRIIENQYVTEFTAPLNKIVHIKLELLSRGLKETGKSINNILIVNQLSLNELREIKTLIDEKLKDKKFVKTLGSLKAMDYRIFSEKLPVKQSKKIHGFFSKN